MFPENKTTLSIGRNGTMTTIGVEIFQCCSLKNAFTEMWPITSKNERGRCKIEIPAEVCPYTALETLMKQKKILPTLMGIHPLLDKLIAETLSKETQ
jgi:hypothetical protein